ncbi:N-acetylmuramoyl-L-alanine amidase [Nitratifractor sp.]
MGNRVLALFLIAALSLAAHARDRILRSVKTGYDRLILRYDRPMLPSEVRTLLLRNAKTLRYVFDFRHTRLAGPDLLRSVRYHAPVRSIRLAQYRPHTVRLVVETAEPYAVAHYAIPKNGYVVALPKGSSSVHSLFAGIKTLPVGRKKAHPAHVVYHAGRTVRAKPKARLICTPYAHLKKRYTVVIDPGHGGHDSGALDPTHRYMEKRAVLAIARKVARHLKRMGFRVLMTRSSDRFIKLHRRTRYANFKHADIFVSIHANAVGNLRRASTARGVETYYLSPARSARARRVAAKENSIAFRKYYRESMNVYLQTLTRSKIVYSNMLALDVQSHILKELRKHYKGVVDGGVRPAPFWVLVGAEMPAILVETGYITHPSEKRRLYDPRYQDLLARGIAEGIARFLANRERELE